MILGLAFNTQPLVCIIKLMGMREGVRLSQQLDINPLMGWVAARSELWVAARSELTSEGLVIWRSQVIDFCLLEENPVQNHFSDCTQLNKLRSLLCRFLAILFARQ